MSLGQGRVLGYHAAACTKTGTQRADADLTKTENP